MMIGEVEGLYRYPVKSALGEAVTACRVTARGLEHDRSHALIDIASGQVVSAKRPRLWRGMLMLTARHDDGEAATGLRISRHGGEERAIGDPDLDLWLSQELGRPVRLISTRRDGLALHRSRPDAVLAEGVDADVAGDDLVMGQQAPAGGFFDFAPIHVVFTSAMRAIAAAVGFADAEAARYRANIVIDDKDCPAFAETAWIGRRLVIGATELALTHPTPRCAIPTLAQADLPARPGVLRAIAAANMREFLDFGPQPCLGLYAGVRNDGTIQRGDAVRLE